MRLPVAAALLLVAPLAPLARAAAPGDPITAARRTGAIAVDGRLDEPDWQRASPYDGFAQYFPEEGAPPSEATEIRVLHDDRTLYLGVRCRDRDPGAVVRAMGRRDSAPASDQVLVMIDSEHDHRMGYLFVVTAAGVQEDGILFADDHSSKDWDAVWQGAAAVDAEGWSAELAIPLAALRFSNAPEQLWGLGVKRVIARRHEEILSFRMPRSARGMLRLLNPLGGLADLRAARALAVTPYTAARVARRPVDEDDLALGRVTDPTADLGLDLRAGIGRGLTLQGTLNPDFGQVEADQILQNLTTYELFFPEKRPFFTEGMDLFEPVSPANRRAPFQLFYSRRIGLDAPILGAAKLTGNAGHDVQIGVVDAVVTGDGFAGAGGRGLRLLPSQPLHLGPADALPELDPARRNFLAAVARYQPAPGRVLGATVTSALPLDARCTQAEIDRADAADADHPPRCDAYVGNAAAVDFSARSPGAEWFVLGEASGSQYLGGDPHRTLADGTVLRRGDPGYGGYLAAGRDGGAPWRGELHYEYESPRLELNAAGYQRTQNQQVARGILRYTRPEGGSGFHSYLFFGGAEARFTTDGRGLVRGQQVWAGFQAQLRSFHWIGCTALLDGAAWDVREISESGIAYRRPLDDVQDCWISTDASRPAFAELEVTRTHVLGEGALPATTSWATSLLLVARPHPRIESRLELKYEDDRLAGRYVDDDGATYLFADLHAPAASVLLREQVVLTPRLTLQLYGQLFTSYGHYGRYYRAAPGGARKVTAGDLAPGTGGWQLDGVAASPEALAEGYDFRDVALNVNAVLRWEYRPGSTFFAVYSRAQAEPDPTAAPATTVAPRGLGRGPATDTFLVKWTWYWNA